MGNTKKYKLEAFGKLLDVLDELRVKCPWDKKQTNESLRCNTIEEVYELSSALINSDTEDIKKELGDVLLHIIFYAKIADEKGDFDIADVCDSLRSKLVYRHPHVFGEIAVKNSAEVEDNWEKLKLKEKGGNKTVLSGVPEALPTLIKAERIQDKAAHAGFDWEKPEDVWQKVKEEVSEVEAELTTGTESDKEAEFGDLLFSLINAARLYKVNVDNALERTNRKFISRFNYIEQQAKERGKSLDEMTLAEMDELWNEYKEIEKKK
jgi:MazG family protein